VLSLGVILLLVPLVLAGGLVTALLRRYALLALFCLVPLNGITLPVGHTNVRTDQALGVLMIVGLGLSAAFYRRRLYVDTPLVLIVVLLGLNALATVFVSPAPGYSAMQVLNLTATWAIYAVIVNCVDTVDGADRLTRLFLMLFAAAAVVGIFAFAAGIAGFRTGMANVEGGPLDGGQAYGAFGTAVEPNIFGSMCQSAFVVAAAMLLLGVRRRVLLWAIVVTTGLGLLLSFTRGAWLGAICGLLATALLAPVVGRRISLAPLALPTIAGALGLAWLWTDDGPAGLFFRYKVENLINPQSETASYRLVSYGLAWEQVLQKPVFGWGTFTFAPLLAQGSDVKELGVEHAIWISNYVLLILHDTGIVGLVVFVLLVAAVLRLGLRAARALIGVDRTESAATVVALVASVIGLLISFLATSGFTFTYPWVVIGLIGAYGRAVGASPRSLRYSS
jgi:putative inorganic carbon (HCO3(-)) transporter